QSFAQQEAVETPQPEQQPRSRACLVVVGQAPGQVIVKYLAACLGQPYPALVEPAVEQRQITAIGLAGIVRHTLFQPEGIEEAVNQGIIESRHGHPSAQWAAYSSTSALSSKFFVYDYK